MAKEQPARISYFFGKGYVDLWNTIKEAWALNLATVVDQRDRMKKNFSEFGWDKEKIIYGFKGAISLVTMLAIFIFGSIITAFTTAFHVGILVFSSPAFIWGSVFCGWWTGFISLPTRYAMPVRTQTVRLPS